MFEAEHDYSHYIVADLLKAGHQCDTIIQQIEFSANFKLMIFVISLTYTNF